MMELTATVKRMETSPIRRCPHSALFLSRDLNPKIQAPLAYSLSLSLTLANMGFNPITTITTTTRPLTRSHNWKSFGTYVIPVLISLYLP